MQSRQANQRSRRATRRAARFAIEALEQRLVLSGTHEQALLNIIDSALQPSNPTGLTAFNSELKGGTALGLNLSVVGSGMAAYDPGSALAGLLARVGSTYTSVSGLVAALENGTGITVTSSSDLPDNIELNVTFSSTTITPVALAQNYGVALLDPTTVNMSTALTENLVLGSYWDANTSSAVFYVDADNSSIQVSSRVASIGASPLPPAMTNSGFESPVLATGTYEYDPAGAGWTFTGGTADANSGISANGSLFGVFNGGPNVIGGTQYTGNAPQGSQVGFIEGDSSIAQSLNISSAEAGNYTLSLSAAQRVVQYSTGAPPTTFYAPDKEDIQVMIDGVVVDTIAPNSAYTTFTTPVITLKAGSHVLTLQGLDAGGVDGDGVPDTAFIDAVGLNQHTGAELGFIQASGGITSASFSPTFNFSLNDQTPVDSAEAAGRLTLSQLTGTPLALLVSAQVTQPAPATVTATLSTPLTPGANPIVFTWPDVNAPTVVSSTLTTDPSLTQLNELQAVDPTTIALGLDEVTEDLSAAATNNPPSPANPFYTDLPLLGESINNLVDFTTSSSAPYSIFQTYLTNYTDPVSTSTGAPSVTFASDQQLMTLIQDIPGAKINTLTETANGSQLLFDLGMTITVPGASTPFAGFNVSPQLNIANSAFPNLTPTVAVTLELSFGEDVTLNSSTGNFFVTATGLPAVQVNVTASAPMGGAVELGLLNVNVTGGALDLSALASVTLTDPMTDSPATPGIITANELMSGEQSSGVFLPVPATTSLSGTASVTLPISVNTSLTGGNALGLTPETIDISWANVSQPTAYVFNTSSLGEYLGWNNLSAANFETALGQAVSAANDVPGNNELGQVVGLLGTDLGGGAALGAALQPPPVVGDSGFETPSVAGQPNGYEYNPGGSSWVFPANVNTEGISVGTSFGGGPINPAPEGTQDAFIDAQGHFSQSITWPILASSYTLTISAAGFSGENVQVLIDGAVVATIAPTTTTFQDYTTPAFTVPGGAHTLTFQGVGSGIIFIDNVRVAVLPSPPVVTDIQSLYSDLVAEFGVADVSMTTTTDGILLSLDVTQNYTGNLNWSVDNPVSGSDVSADFSASGTVPVTATYLAKVPLGIVLTASATPANQFYIQGGQDFGGTIYANTTTLSGSATLGNSSVTYANGSVEVGATNSGGAFTGSPSSLSLSLGTSGQRISLPELLAAPQTYFGSVVFSGAASLKLPLGGLPSPGAHPEVDFLWPNPGIPSTLTITPTDLGALSTTTSYNGAAFINGIGALLTEIGTWQSSSVVKTDLPWIDETIDQVIPFIEDFQTVFQNIQGIMPSSAATLNSDVLGVSLPTGATLTATHNNNPGSNDFEYTLSFNVVNKVIDIPFAFGAGFDKLLSLNTNVDVTANAAANLTFGFNPARGFYVLGNNGSTTPQISLSASDVNQKIAQFTTGKFGNLPIGVGTGALLNLSAAYGFSLLAPGDDGNMISRTELAKDGMAIFQPTITAGTNSIVLPFGLQLGASSSAYVAGVGPGITGTFTANWDPTQVQPMEFGADNSTDPSDGFDGSIKFDLSEFVADLIGPYLRDIQQYNPIPQALLSALNYNIPVINMTPADILVKYVGDGDGSNVATMIHILSLVSSLPTTTDAVNLSQYLVGAPNSGVTGWTDGGVSENGTDASIQSSFIDPLESASSYDIQVPALSDPETALAQTLAGQVVTLIDFNPGYISDTWHYDTQKLTFPIFSLGILDAQAYFQAGISATLFGNIDIGLTTRGLLGDYIGAVGGAPNLLDGFYIGDEQFGGDTSPYQMGLEFEGHVTVGGEIALGGAVSLVGISGSLGPAGLIGIRVNDVYYVPGTNTPIGIADYQGNPAGDGKAYIDELQWISSNFGPLCAIMPAAEFGVQLTINATIGDPPIGFTFTVYSHLFVISEWNVPCAQVLEPLATVQGDALVLTTPNTILSADDGANNISAGVWYNPVSGDAEGLTVVESNKDQNFYQNFSFAQLAGVNTLVMNGTNGDDTFNFDPNLTEPNFDINNTESSSTVQIQYLTINTLNGNDAADLNTLTTKNSNLLGLRIIGGNGTDHFEGNYCPDYISLGSGANFAYIGTGDGEVVESSGDDNITGGNGNDTVQGGTGSATILLGNGNNIVNEGPGAAKIDLGNGQNLITSSSLVYNSGLVSNGSSLGNPPATDGSQAAFIQGNSAITQSTGLWPGGTVYLSGGNLQTAPSTYPYFLTFSAAQAASNAGSEDFEVLIDGTVIAQFDPTSTTYQDYMTPEFLVKGGYHLITFKGLDTAGGANMAFIDNVRLTFVNPLLSVPDQLVPPNEGGPYDPSFESTAVAAGSYVANDIVAPDYLGSDTSYNPTTTINTGGWTYIAGIGIDTIAVGDGNNTIHGDLGGSTIKTGVGQDIIYAGGAGTNDIVAGGGNDIISVNLLNPPVLQLPPGMFAPVVSTFTVDGGSGKTLLDVQGNGNIILSNDAVTLGSLASPTLQLQFTDISSVALSGGGGTVSFDVSRWTGSPVQISGGGGSATIVSTNHASFTLSDNSLSRSDGTSFALSGIGTADLTSNSAQGTFDVTGWHAGGVIDGTGSNDTLIAAGLTTATLTNSLLQRAGATNLALLGITQADLTASLLGGANINTTAFTGNAAIFGQGSNNTLQGGGGGDYIVGGPGANNLLVGNSTTDNQIVGGAGSHDTIDGGAGENVLVSSAGGGDTITTGTGPSRVYTPGKNNTINAQGGNAIVYLATSGNSVNTGSSTTDQTLNPGQAGTTPSDFVAPSTTDLWEFPSPPATASPTLPTGTAGPGQWVQFGTSASGGGISASPGGAIDPSVVAAGSGASSVQYVAWADNRSGTYQIYVAQYSSSGWSQLAGSAQGGGISNGGPSTQPSIALDTAGYPVVAWSEAGNIFVAEYNPSANSGQGGWVALGTSLSAGGISSTGAARAPQIVNTSSGPVVAWLDTSGGSANVFAREFNGTSWTTVSSGSASGHGLTGSSAAVPNFSLATDGTDLALAWTQPGTSAGNSIYVIQNTGSGWTGVDGANTGNGISGTFTAQTPSVAYAGGSLYAAWAADTDGTFNIVAAVAAAPGWQSVSIDTPTSAGINQISRGAASNPVLSSNGSALDLVWIEDRLPNTADQAVAIYANRLVGGQFKAQLPGDSSFDGVLGRSTSLSQPAALALAVDGAGHPFIDWGDGSSGSSQVYMLGDTLDIHQIIYVNDAIGPDDSYTTAAGNTLANGATGLTPALPVSTIDTALTLATSPNDVILVDSGVYSDITITSAANNGVVIIGSPDGSTDIVGGVNIIGAQNLTLESLEFTTLVTISGSQGIELNNDSGGSANNLALDIGGLAFVTGSTGVTFNEDSLVGVQITGAASSGITLTSNSLPGTGLQIDSAITNLQVYNNLLETVAVSAPSQGVIADNNINGGGLGINASFTGGIDNNYIHGAIVGVTYDNTAALNNNQIFHNHTGIAVSATSNLGFLAGSGPNYIVDNGTGVRLNGLMQGQFIGANDTGVSGSGFLGGSLLADANQIQGNVTGVNFSGSVQYNRIDYNENSIIVQSGQLIAHNLIYDNNGQNLQSSGASNVEIVNNSFYSPSVTNVLVNGGSSDVEVLNNILWTGGGYDLDIADDSRTGYFSDYNDLYTTGGGLSVHYLVDFSDLLDWQDDVNLYDLHSIGTTVVNPTLDQPQFVNLAFADFSVLPTDAGIRNTSPTIATGDPESDLALPAVQYNNLLTNASFESGTAGWTVNPGGTTQSSSPTAFDGSSYFFSGAVASGFAQQTISLLSDGYTAGQLDAQDLDISFGGRIRSASETLADQGQIVITFLDGSGNTIGTPTTVSASNVSDRWELVGARVHIPQGARSVAYRFQSVRESGSTDDSYLDAAFLYVLPNTLAMDMGAYGGSNDTAGAPVDQKIQLQTPDLYVNWTLTQSHNILWSTFDNTGDSPVKIDLYQQTSGGLTFLLNITPSTADTGLYAWVPQSSGLTYGTYGLRIKVSLVGTPAIDDFSTENFTIPENGNLYYVNDNSRTGDQYTTAAGNNRATGKIPSAPLPLLTTLMRTYAPGATATVYVDTGTYFDFAPVELSGNPAIGNGAGVTIIGPAPGGGAAATINALGFTAPAVVDVNDATFVTLSNLGFAGANYGLWVRNASANFAGQYLTATGNDLSGIRLESDSTAGATLTHITVDNNTGDGLYAGGPIVNLTNSVAYNNTGDGFDLANAGAAVLSDDIAYGNVIGLNVINTTSGTTTAVGNANLALGLGNEFYNNMDDGISANGSILLAGNIAYGQTASGDAGIILFGGATATENIAYNNYDGILSGTSPSSITYNLAYNNSNIGIEGDIGATLTGNVAYSNTVGIRSMSPPNAVHGPFITNNLVYNNSVQGIWLTGGNSTTIYNNTVYQPAGDALHIDAYAGLPASGIQIENNILWTQNGFDIWLDPTSENGFKSDYNDLYFTAAGKAGKWESVGQTTLVNWQTATANDADSISTDPLFVNAGGGDFHEQSLAGSFHNGSLAPVIGGSGLPVSATGTLTSDAAESPAIDRGDPSFSFTSEPSPNGGYINLGAFGDTAQASLSPTSYVLVLKPLAGETLVEGQKFTIVWRSQDMSGTVNIDLVQGGTTLSIVAGASDTGSYTWTIPTSITPGAYTVRVTRNAAPTAVGFSGTIFLSAAVVNYYVNGSTTGGTFTTAGGSDANSGLDPAHPKATIQNLLASYQLGGGDTIFIDQGTYNLSSNIVLTAANNGLTIEGVSGGGTILDRTNTATGSYVFDLQGASNVTLQSLSITGGQYGLNASGGAGSTGLKVASSFFYGSQQIGINLGSGNGGAQITNSTFHDMVGSSGAAGIETSGDQVTISGDTAYNLGFYGFYIVNANNSTISGNIAYNDGIGIYTDVSTVSSNIAYNDPNAGILIAGNSTVTGNTTYDNISTKNVSGFPQAGIELGGGTASGNISYGNVYGIYFTGNFATASDNLVYNNSTAGISGGNAATILGNVLYGNGLGISSSSFPAAAATGPVIENNLLYNNITGGIYLLGGDTTPILNNTVYQTAGDGLQIVVYSGEPTNNVQVRDNIFWNSAGPDISVDSGSEEGVQIDYNDLYAVNTGTIGSWGGATYATLATWQGATGMDAHSISTDPLFVNAAAFDFHEQSLNGSYHGGTLAPVLNTTTGLPQPNPGTLTDDANESPAIDRGSPSDSYANEPLPNGGYVNLGAYGNSIQASLSPHHYLFITNPIGGQNAAAGQGLSILWRDEVANTGAGASDTDTLQLLEPNNNNTIALTTSAADTGTYVWNLPSTLTAGVYEVRVIRNDGTGLSATSAAFNISAFDGIYYVNGSSTGGVFTTAGGNDSNSGLDPAHPKATIAAIFAAYTLQPGNVIMVDSATYNLTANMVLTAADDGITIEGVGGGKTTLNRGSTTSGSYAFDIQGATNVTLEGLTITGAYVGVNASYGNISTGLTVTNCTFVGDQYIGIDLQGSNGTATVSNNNFDGSLDGTFAGSAGLYSQANSVVVDLNIAYGMSYGIEINGGTTAAGDTIDNNTVYDNSTGISVASSNTGTWAVNGNTVYDNFQTNLTLTGGMTASGNIVYQDGGAGSNEVSFEEGFNIANGPVVTNSVIYGNVIGIEMANGATASGNRVYDNSGGGIVLTSQDTVIGNDVYSNGKWGILYSNNGGVATTIANNLVYANATGGIDLSNAYLVQVSNNTVFQTSGPAVEVDGTGSYSSGVFSPTVNLQNNILWTTAGPDVNVADGMEEGFTSDYNDLYFTATGEVAQMAGVNFTTLSSWAWELGLDTHGISVDPQFVNPAGPDGLLGYSGGADHGVDDDFHVKSTSPTIDAGNPASDFLSEPTPNGGRVNLGYDGDTAQAAASSSATTVQVVSPSNSGKVQAGQPTTIQWLSSGLLSTQTITEVATGESVAVGEYHSSEFSAFATSTAFTNSSINTSLVTNPAPQAVYQNYAYAATGAGNYLSYLIPVPNGTYTMRLDFAEPQFGSAGARTFDVLLQGQVVQPNFDIYATAGDTINKAVALTFTVTATGGSGISLELKNDTSNPAILNGFEISAANAGGTANPTANIQVSTNSGSTWSTIATNQPMDSEGRGSFVWTPTASTTGYTALIRVVANNSASTTGVSGSFLIANSGASFYVNDSSTVGDVYTTAVGNNANSGTSPGAPMASIEAVLNDYQLVPGDTIYVDNGVYTLFHNINIPVADSGVIIQGPTATGTSAVLNRNATGTNDDVFYLVPAVQNVTLADLGITGSYYGINSPLVEGTTTLTSGITVENNQIYSNAYHGIDTGFTNNWTITGNVIHDNAAYGIYMQGCTGTVTNNTVYNEPADGIFFSNSSAVVSAGVVSGNTVYGDGTGIYVDGDTVTGNFAHDNTSMGIYADTYSVVTGNTVWRQTATNAVGIQVSNATVADNAVFGNYNGIFVNGGEGIHAYGNRVYSNTNYGLLLENVNGSAYSIGYNYVATAYSNLIYANSTGGVFISSPFDLSLVNNTIYQLVGSAVVLSGSITTTYPLTIENNILWVQAGDDLDLTSTSTQPGLVSDYNILDHTGANAYVGVWNGTSESTLAAWHAASALDSHSNEGNPLFVDPAGADAVLGYNAAAQNGNGYNGGGDDNFFVAAGSPAIGAGNHAVAPPMDLLGYTFNTTPDVGAYAYRGTAADSTPATVVSVSPGASQITVVFSEIPNDIDAAASSLYVLRGAGPDGIFGTSDDVIYSVTASYQTGTSQALLSVNGGPLPNGLYQLTILSNASASVHNRAGVALDGNNDGVPGGNYVTSFTLGPSLDVINGTGGSDTITLTRDADTTDIDWTLGATVGKLAINDPDGLTINANGGNETLVLNPANGNPLPGLLRLNGSFTINGLTGPNPLANTTLDIVRSTVYISYGTSDPLTLVQQYLRNGYNNGLWNGSSTASTGVIISSAAAQDASQTTAVGYADSADGLITGQPANTIELKYTLYGDTALGGSVGFNAFTRLTQHYNQTTGATWDTGDFNYDGSVNFADFTLLTRTYNTSLTPLPTLDTIAVTAGITQITLKQDADRQHVDWTMGSLTERLADTDPNGLTIDGNGGNVVITLDYRNGNPLPATAHLNGTFTINGLQGTNPLADTTLEIGRSTVYIAYSTSDPIAAIKGYLKNGFNNGAWNGSPTAVTGVITSIPAAQNAAQTTAIGYADSADGLVPGQPANTIELKYTLYGDTGLTGFVGFNNFTRLTQHYNQTAGGTWDTGDFNYDGSVNFSDFTLMTRTYNTSLGSQAKSAVSATQSTTTTGLTDSTASADPARADPQSSPSATPSVASTPDAKLPIVKADQAPPTAHHTVTQKRQRKHRR